ARIGGPGVFVAEAPVETFEGEGAGQIERRRDGVKITVAGDPVRRGDGLRLTLLGHAPPLHLVGPAGHARNRAAPPRGGAADSGCLPNPLLAEPDRAALVGHGHADGIAVFGPRPVIVADIVAE